ncbi:LacI family DNA-binding transcriptional regulator [Halomonas sp.]|uniref:LacI family DNA-binding transcriptional regulator n=1 Tax=Halomonas sp. TaxID=1486246 RepID=UPI00356A0FD5
MDNGDKVAGGERRVQQRARRQGRIVTPTLTDVARMAGVSTATVSRVLNNTGQVREDLRRAVEEAIEALGYVPKSAARSLVSQRYNTIGAIANSLK